MIGPLVRRRPCWDNVFWLAGSPRRRLHSNHELRYGVCPWFRFLVGLVRSGESLSLSPKLTDWNRRQAQTAVIHLRASSSKFTNLRLLSFQCLEYVSWRETLWHALKSLQPPLLIKEKVWRSKYPAAFVWSKGSKMLFTIGQDRSPVINTKILNSYLFFLYFRCPNWHSNPKSS